MVTALFYALSLFTENYELTQNNIGLVLGAPRLLAETIFGAVAANELGSIWGAIRHTTYHAITLLVWYVLAAILLREKPTSKNE